MNHQCLSHKLEVLFRHPVDARAQHHNEPYATNVPGGISDVSPSADGVEDIGEVLGYLYIHVLTWGLRFPEQLPI